MKKFIAKETKWIRHKIVKIIAPHFYETSSILSDLVGTTPRPMILIAKSYFNHSLVGAEIGVNKGDNAISILQTLPMKTLYLIDPYIAYIEYEVKKEYSQSYNVAKERLSNFPQTKFIIKTSDEACKDIHEPLDFVYIDGNHNYEYVKRDIENYYPLVKPTGIIGGHDYTRDFSGVGKASREFGFANNLRLYTIFPDWWIFKDKRE